MYEVLENARSTTKSWAQSALTPTSHPPNWIRNQRGISPTSNIQSWRQNQSNIVVPGPKFHRDYRRANMLTCVGRRAQRGGWQKGLETWEKHADYLRSSTASEIIWESVGGYWWILKAMSKALKPRYSVDRFVWQSGYTPTSSTIMCTLGILEWSFKKYVPWSFAFADNTPWWINAPQLHQSAHQAV